MYHLHSKIKNATKSSSAAVVAYRVGENLRDPRDGKLKYPHRARGEVLAYFTVNWKVPGTAAGTKEDCQGMIDEIGRTETRSNSRFFREFEVALPKEGTRQTRRKLLEDFAIYFATKYNVAALAAIHSAPDSQTGNEHGHILLTTRTILREGGEVYLGEKNRLLDSSAMIVEARETWEKLLNRYYEMLKIEKTVSCKSYEKQRIGRIPTIHEGPYHHRSEGPRWQANQGIRHLNEIASQGAKSPEEVWANVEVMRTELVRKAAEVQDEIGKIQEGIRNELATVTLSLRQNKQMATLKAHLLSALKAGKTPRTIASNLREVFQRGGVGKSAVQRLRKSLPPGGGDKGVQRARDGTDLMVLFLNDANEVTLANLKRWASGETQAKPIALADLSDPFWLERLRDWELTSDGDEPPKAEIQREPSPKI